MLTTIAIARQCPSHIQHREVEPNIELQINCVDAKRLSPVACQDEYMKVVPGYPFITARSNNATTEARWSVSC
jgi:hypothetical protein